MRIGVGGVMRYPGISRLASEEFVGVGRSVIAAGRAGGRPAGFKAFRRQPVLLVQHDIRRISGVLQTCRDLRTLERVVPNVGVSYCIVRWRVAYKIEAPIILFGEA